MPDPLREVPDKSPAAVAKERHPQPGYEHLGGNSGVRHLVYTTFMVPILPLNLNGAWS